MDVEEAGWIGDRRVSAVKDADLHQFISRHVGGQRDADLFESGSTGWK
jgi:hypothetical protein